MRLKLNGIVGRNLAKRIKGEYSHMSYRDVLQYSPVDPKTTHLDLSGNWCLDILDPNEKAIDLQALLIYFRTFPYGLTELDLSNNTLLTPYLSHLLKVLPETLTVLKLKTMLGVPPTMEQIAQVVSAIPNSVTELDLSSSWPTKRELFALFTAMGKKTNITKVTLSDFELRQLSDEDLLKLAQLAPHLHEVIVVDHNMPADWITPAAMKLNVFLNRKEKTVTTNPQIDALRVAIESLMNHAMSLSVDCDVNSSEKGQTAVKMYRTLSERANALADSLDKPEDRKRCFIELNQALANGLKVMGTHRNFFKRILIEIAEFLGFHVRPGLAGRNAFFPETERQNRIHDIKEVLDVQFPENGL